MKTTPALLRAVLLVLVLLAPAPLPAQSPGFTLVNNTDIDFSKLMVRRFGTQEWVPLVVTPVPVRSAGGKGAVQFENEDCAYDLQATLPNGQVVVWSGLNLCDAKSVTLNRRATGELWADYQ